MGLPMVGHFGLEEAGHPGIKNMNSSKCYKTHFLPTVQPIPCFMGGGPLCVWEAGPWGKGGSSSAGINNNEKYTAGGEGGGRKLYRIYLTPSWVPLFLLLGNFFS